MPRPATNRHANRAMTDAGLDSEGAISSRPYRHRRWEAYVGGDREVAVQEEVSGPTPEGGHCVIEGHVFAQVEAGLAAPRTQVGYFGDGAAGGGDLHEIDGRDVGQ